MNRKISLGLCLALVIMAVAGTYAVTMISSRQIYNSIISNLSSRTEIGDTFDEIDEYVANFFYDTSGQDESGSSSLAQRLSSAMAEGYIRALGDEDSRYLSADEYAEYLESINGTKAGAGIEARYDQATDKYCIAYVYAGSPAESAGLKYGDVIVSVNDVTITKNNYSFYGERPLYGNEPNATVKIVYERNGEKKTVNPNLGFVIPTVFGRIYTASTGTQVGYIRFSSFSKTTASDLATMVEKLRESGATTFIFDVRNVSEGTIEYAAAAIDTVVTTNSGSIAVARAKDGSVYSRNGEKKFAATTSKVTESCAVLINSYTSGPAELFACDLKDMRAAKLVGTTTAGVGTMQDVFTLQNGGALLLTVAVVEPNKGADGVYDGKGVEPTDYVSLGISEGTSAYLLDVTNDAQLAKAIDILK